MNRLVTLLSSEFCGNIVLALLHTLWQAVIITVLLYMFLRSKTGKEASKRYMASIVALAAIVLCGLFTWAVLNYEPLNIQQSGSSNLVRNQTTEIMSNSEEGDNVVSITQTESHKKQSSQVFGSATWYVWVMCLWMIGVMIMLCRTVHIVIGAGRLRRQCRLLENEPVLELIEQLRQSMGIARKICVAVNDHICVPGVIGFVWPTLLLPASMISGIPIDDLKAILSHELAHIRRYDYLVNFCQMIIEALLFFNPAVWWISRQIRIEREACCDATGAALTGEKVGYARVLADWAHRLADRRGGAASSAIIGFAGSDQSGSMLDRVKRIVVPGHRPKMKVAWYVTVALLMASAILLAGLWQGTNLTVAFVAKILTPAERIQKMKEIAETYKLYDREYTEADRITVSGMVRTIDSSELPNDVRIHGTSSRPGYSASYSVDLKNGRFSRWMYFGKVYLRATAIGYAPAFVGPLETEVGGQISEIELVLDRGFEGRVKIVDQYGNPIAGARLQGGYVQDPGVSSRSIEIFSNDAGVAIIEHYGKLPIKLQVTADGYEYDQKQFTLESGSEEVWKLEQAAVTTGVVVSKATGEPIAEVDIGLVHTKGAFWHGSGPYSNTKVVTQTDKQGRFELSSLRSDTIYYFQIKKVPGYGIVFPYKTTTGQKDLRITLGEELYIRGRIVGDVARLTKRNGKAAIHYSNPYIIDDGSHSHQRWRDVTIQDGVGYFEIIDLWPGTVRIWAGKEPFVFDVVDKPLKDVVIDLRPEKIEQQMREVILTFDVPEGSPEPEGGIRIDYITEQRKKKNYSYIPKWLDIDEGQVRLEIPVPSRFKYNIDYNQGVRPVGYWFAESKPIDIKESNEPFLIKIPLHPAGAIYGRTLFSDGSLAEDARASLIVSQKPSYIEGHHDLANSLYGGGQGMGKFNGTPLPLDGEYVILVRHNDSYVVSKPILLDETNPIQQIDIQLAEGLTLEGQLLDTDGIPIQKAVSLSVSIRYPDTSWSTKGKDIRPDENGYFAFYNVNPGFPGEYFINVVVGPGYRPMRERVDNFDEPITTQLEKGQILRGVVIDDATGWPVPGVEVYALPEDYSKPEPTGYLDAEEKTDEHGQFRFSNMAERKYRLGVRSANLANPRTSVTATGGQEEPVTLRIKIPEWSDLKPRKPAF